MVHSLHDSFAAVDSALHAPANEPEGHDLQHELYVKDGPISESSWQQQRLLTACYHRLSELERDNYFALCEKPYTLMAFSYICLIQVPNFSSSQFSPNCFQSLTTLHFTKTGLENERLDCMHLESVENLRELTLAKNKLTEFPLKLVMSLLHLEELDLSSNVDMRLTYFSTGFEDFARVMGSREHHSLKILNLHGCDILVLSEQFFWSFPKFSVST